MKKLLLVPMAVMICANIFAQNAFVYNTYNGIFRTEILLSDNTGFSINTKETGGFGYSNIFWAERNGSFYLATSNPVTDHVTYLAVSKNGTGVIPALNFSVNGRWVTSEITANVGTLYPSNFTDSTKEYPILGVRSSTIMAVLENFNTQNQKITEVPYSVSNGILVFTFNGTEYRYFGVLGVVLVRIKGNDSLSPVYAILKQ